MNDDLLQDGELRKLAKQLGQAGDRVDVERVALAVVQRMREQPRATRWTTVPRVWLRLAAAVVLLIGAGAVLRSVRQSQPMLATPSATGGVDLNELSADQLREVMSTIDQWLDQEPAGLVDTGGGGGGGGGLDDLTAPELRRLLRSLEG